MCCDLADREQLDELLAEAESADILVANAALAPAGALDEVSTEEVDRALDVNLRAPLALANTDGVRGHVLSVLARDLLCQAEPR